jgi:hypothetical protein
MRSPSCLCVRVSTTVASRQWDLLFDERRDLPFSVGALTEQSRGPPAPLSQAETECSKSKSHYDRRSVGQSVLVSSPIWVSWPDINFCLSFTVLSMSGAPSDARSGLSSVLVTWTASVQFSNFAAGLCRLLYLRRVWSAFFTWKRHKPSHNVKVAVHGEGTVNELDKTES